MLTEFRNEAFTNFKLEENADAMQKAIAQVRSQLGATYPIVIGGERIETEDHFTSTNPSNPDEVIGHFCKADQKLAEKAMQKSWEAFATWSRVVPEERARYLFQAASIMRRQKFGLAALMCLEIGKNWAEADGDVAEAIDFCEYYAREMLRLGGAQPVVPYPGEHNELRYIPLGVGVILPPWNFPLAISIGMCVASIVTGNTVIFKPSSETLAIGYKVYEVMKEAGLPDGVLNFVPGSEEVIGDFLVGHPRTRFVVFTGSKEVGLHVNELAAKTAPGQIWIKRVIAEMGGKDAIIVDQDVDLDEAAAGIVASAFGFQGQKCSACSRAIIHEQIYDLLSEKIVKRALQLKVGSAEKGDTDLGPVASKSQYKTVLDYIEIGRKEGRLFCGPKSSTAGGGGYFVAPTVIGDVNPDARIAREEIFGPVLALVKAKDWRHGLEIANSTEFGLTGAAYSKNRAHIEEARRDFHVGNLYLNRKCTGALVGVHPFGGFNMSGTDSKAGGPDYLLLFMQGKSIAEKI